MSNIRRLAEIGKGETLYVKSEPGQGLIYFTRLGRKTGRYFGSQLPKSLIGRKRQREVQQQTRKERAK